MTKIRRFETEYLGDFSVSHDQCVKDAIKYLQPYISSYHKQQGYQDYSIETYINDVLYGLGVSISGRYEGAPGFRKFQERLLKQLEGELNGNKG